ncbi:hypothetical protein [Exiguobacterium sp. S22-S28]|uniref:hypothetical protein n=1 Tax=Exiguobacterium sp. S22-S28 TaxID=3342768 RepID=UPI00372CFFAE
MTISPTFMSILVVSDRTGTTLFYFWSLWTVPKRHFHHIGRLRPYRNDIFALFALFEKKISRIFLSLWSPDTVPERHFLVKWSSCTVPE